MATGGRAILAFSDDDDEVFERFEARRGPDHPIAIGVLRRAVDQARRSGYARTSAQARVRSVGAPIFDSARTPVGALTVSAPKERMEKGRFAEVVDDCVTTATRLSESLGRL